MSIPGGKKLPLYLKQKRFQVLSNDIGIIIYRDGTSLIKSVL